MKKRKLLLVAALGAMLVTGACSNGGNAANDPTNAPTTGGESSQTPSTPEKKVNITFWGAIQEENGPKDVVDAWNMANPNIQVEYVRYVNDNAGNTKLDTALISKSDAPDIFISYGETHLNRRVNAGMAAPLDDLMAQAGLDVDDIIGSDNIMKYDNKIFSLPAMKLVAAVLLNQSALDEAGVALPEDWTWEEHNELAKKLTKGDRKGTYIAPPSESIPRFALIESKSVDPYYKDDGTSNFDSPVLRTALEQQKMLYDQDLMIQWAEARANKVLGQSTFLTGESAMVIGGTHFIRYVKDTKNYPRDFKVAFAPMPQIQKGANVNTAGFNDYMSINKNSENKEAAMKFIAWYLQEGNNYMIPGGRLPSNRHADIDKVVELFVGDDIDLMDGESLKRVLKKDYQFPLQPTSTAYAELSTIMSEELEKYYMNVQDLDQTMNALKSRADKAIQAAQK
ncbi:extracellular solute-binding protein [Paenibacillus sp. HB172176]|uniref:ABC transporter substrate-binding protein n=1 Tax=Paenibacillus sp. HB172176 TaxID=2493690 RepID=UPI0014387E8B|nr:extracellular solute-binding protein [Paenibacillus sp. HB172176]